MVATALAAYIKGLEGIPFPDVATAAASAHIEAAVIFRDRALAASNATTVSTFNASADAAADARDTIFDVQELKDDLGLPVGP